MVDDTSCVGTSLNCDTFFNAFPISDSLRLNKSAKNIVCANGVIRSRKSLYNMKKNDKENDEW